jgi:type I restriction enzyme S subunit
MTLGSVTHFTSGGTPSKENASYWSGQIPWLSAKDMKMFLLEDTQDHLSEEGLQNGSRLAPAGTVFLLARGMTLLNDLPICTSRRPMAFNQDVKGLAGDDRFLATEFLPYLLLGHKTTLMNLVDLAGHGTGRLNTDELKSLSISVPPKEEQRAIANILRSLDERIELSRKISETLEAMAQVLFRSWFVDFDPIQAKADGRDLGLPASIADQIPSSFEDSRLGPIPKGWSVCGLEELGTFLNGLALQKYPAGEDGSLPAIKIAQLRAGSTENADRVSKDIPSNYRINDGDVLFSWSGSLECVVWTAGPGALNQHLFKVTSEKYSKWFYLGWILHHLPEFRRIAAAKATTMGHIQRHHLREALVVAPPASLLGTLEGIFEPLLQASITIRLQSKTLSQIRDTLLPRLISGELRISDSKRFL